MPPFRKPTLVTLRRKGPNQPWGFRLAGGAEVQQPFRIQKVTEDSLAYLGGLSENDEIVRIGNISLRGLTHEEAQQIILRCAYCIDLFVLRENAESIQPRFTLALDSLVNRPPISGSRPQTPITHLPPAGSLMGDYDPVKAQTISFKDTKTYITEEFKNMDPLQRAVATNNKNLLISQVSDPSVGRQEYSPRIAETQPRFPVVRTLQTSGNNQIKDPRVFGLTRSKSPNDTNRDRSISPLPNPEIQNQQFGQEPKTPTTLGMGFDFSGQDLNNNVVDPNQKIVYGLQNREVSVAVPPTITNNHNQATQQQTRTIHRIVQRQRFSSLTGAEYDWKEPLPIVNIPNTDQLLPSQTKQMQTYINQIPPTEKNLRPSLSTLQRRRICPVWPPPSAGRFRHGFNVEGRDSPNSRMMAWPPRASSVDRDFGYGEQARQQTPDRYDGSYSGGRVNSQTRLWPPPSNATPAGFPDIEINDDEQYAYNTYGSGGPMMGTVSTHIPQTYRPPPGTQHLQVNEF